VNKDRVLQKFRSVMILLDSFVYRKHRPQNSGSTYGTVL
jgi:hypothetical protein